MPRGGRRTGTPGAKYENRSDLRKPKISDPVPTGLAYGEHKKQAEARAAIPVPTAVAPTSPSPATAVARPVIPLTEPTQRPDEPLTAGLPVGPGPGPEALVRPVQKVSELIATLSGGEMSGDLADLYAFAQRQGL